MKTATGTKISGGIAVGKLKLYRPKTYEISEEKAVDPVSELERFESAREKVREQQRALHEKVVAEAGEDSAAVFEVHEMMLDDRMISACREIITDQKHKAEYAVRRSFDNALRQFRNMDDPYFRARSADVEDLKIAMLDALFGNEPDSLPVTEPSILVADDLTPSEMVRLDRSLLLGIVMREGSTNSHTAILARSFGLPAIIRCREVEDDWDGKYAALDGYDSKLYIEPPRELIDSLMAKRKDELEKETLLSELRGKQSTTIDGHNMKVYANICDPSEVEAVLSNDAEGVGLFRSEFIYLNSRTDPTEEEQYRAYRKVLEALAPRPVVIRTSDIGADKAIEYLDLEKEENPALGYRAIRICLSRKDFFKRQLRALLRASAHGNLGIMFPMITCLSEVRECKEVLGECRRELENEGAETGNPETGIMIETPAAALLADELAEEVDFFSLGTNDLTQFTCAIDRQNEKIVPFLDTHNPAVLKLIQMTVEAGHRHNIRVGICGELGADLSLTETFLRMGVDELSVNPGSVLPLRKQIRSITLGEIEGPG